MTTLSPNFIGALVKLLREHLIVGDPLDGVMVVDTNPRDSVHCLFRDEDECLHPGVPPCGQVCEGVVQTSTCPLRSHPVLVRARDA